MNINAINELRQRSDNEENVSDHNAELGEPETYDVESFIDAITERLCMHVWNTSLRSHRVLTKRKLAWEKLTSRFGKSGNLKLIEIICNALINIVDSLVIQIHVLFIFQ